MDFVVLDMKEDRKHPLTLGRPFLATGQVLIDVKNGELTLKVSGEEVKYKLHDNDKLASEVDESCTRQFLDLFNWVDILFFKETPT